MTKDEIQKQAVEAWLKKGKRGTFELTTGTGKTIASLHCLRTMRPRDGKVHLFLAETEARRRDLESDILLYNKLFNYDIRDNYNLQFKCYQGVYNLEGYEFGLVIGDEFHNGLTAEYSKFFFNNSYDAIVGLTATVERGIKYTINGVETSKGQLLDKIAPVCYRYTQKYALKDDIGRVLDVYIVEMELNNIDKNIKAGSKNKPFWQTEKGMYNYLHKNLVKCFYMSDSPKKEVFIRNAYKYRSNFLSEMPRRIKEAKLLVDNIPGKSVIFSTSLDAVSKVTPYTVSSKNTDEENEKIRSDFDKGLINTIGSYKMLRQGANLKEVDNCIQMSYHKAETHMIQITGRLRKNGDVNGRVIMFVMKDTFEEDVLNSVLEHIKYNKLLKFKSANDLLKHILVNES